ncbi:hypothetical protein NP493_212g03054 [Ridgeia piscesae]|uniref:Uncharacterized protein n=1 Tax=Ridgeia piscesae TaxID=27915 RepID=A0AAD9P109_RIDPI|nr:hypothetical protein NP493_212g03054 [Ridgeia piscesae]
MLNIIVFAMATRVSCCREKDKQDDVEFGLLAYAGLVLLPLLGVAWVFGVLAVNDDVLAFHYLFAVFTCFYGVFILLAYVLLSKNVRREVKYAVYRLQGRKGYEDSASPTRNSMLSRSALSYHQNDSSLEGGLSRVNVGISTTSTTSRSTSKSGGGLYHPDPYLHSSSTSTNPNAPYDYPPNAGIPPYGYDSAQFNGKPPTDDPDTGEMDRKRRVDSDSDSDSAMENPDLDLASSHSSDDEDDDNFAWDAVSPRQQTKPSQLESSPKKKWPSGHSGHNELGIRSPDQVKISPHKKAPEKSSQRNSLKGSKENVLCPSKRPKVKMPREQVPVLTHNGSITSDSE